MTASQRRVALYSPGMVGLGHMRRNLLIAQALAASESPTAALLIAEAREASSLAMPPGVDCFTLPALRKDGAGAARPRYLDLPLGEVVAVRAKAIEAVLEAFAPDVLIADHLPRGALGELEPALQAVRRHSGTRCILGLRDVLGEPTIVRREWRRRGNVAAIRRYYDAVWVYGHPAVYDAVREYAFPLDVAARVRYTGYLDHRERLRFAELNGADPVHALGLPAGPLAVCLVGGGQDGGRLAEAFVRADLPPGYSGIVVTGPFMPAEDRKRVYAHAAGRREVRVLEFVSEPALLLRRADRVVAMGGYNTVWEMLSFGKRVLVVPRMQSSLEQWIRAERLRELGAVDVLRPDQATPDALGGWLARPAESPCSLRDVVDFGGFERLPSYLEDALTAAGGTVPTPSHDVARTA